jgi:adenine-specific DNA-methyltransferase
LKQNINYIGSKYSLLDFLYKNITTIGDISQKSFCDLFAGTNIIGIYFKDKVKTIISNDIEYYSYVIGRKYLNNTITRCDDKLIEELNSLEGVSGNIFNYYSDNGTSGRKYFSQENGKKIDAIRLKIEDWKNNKKINEDCYYYLLASLLEAADKIANTTSVYGAYLKEIKKSAKKPIILKHSDINMVKNQINIYYNEDSNDLIKNIKGDILYIDPPYNQRQYGSNYHILNAISKYDFSIEPKGVVGLMNYHKSKFSSKTQVKKTFEELITNSNFEHIFISYSSEGILKSQEIIEILSLHGQVIKWEKLYKTYKADSSRENKSSSLSEFLFYLRKF